MNRWLMPFLLIGLVSTIALSALSPLFPLLHATAKPVESPDRAPHWPLPTAVKPVVAMPTPMRTPMNPFHHATLIAPLPAPTASNLASVEQFAGVAPPNTATNPPAAQLGTDTTQPILTLTIVELINRQRAQIGLAPLTVIHTLTQAAYRHSLDMGKQTLPTHQGTDGSSGGERMLAAGYQWQGWAEVIGWGFTEPIDMVEWWLNHAEHRAILLSPAFTEFGVGYVTLENSPWKSYWTVNFGRPYLSRPLVEPGAPITPLAQEALPAPVSITPAPQVAQETNHTANSGSLDGCPVVSTQSYTLIPMTDVDLSHPAPIHADLNLAQRSYIDVALPPSFIDLNGPVDEDAPQLAQLFINRQPIQFAALYQVHDWDWGCGGHGCRRALLAAPEATLLGLQTEPGAPLRAPARQASIYRDSQGEEYVAVALYAEDNRLTLAYTRDGSVAHGYVVHLEQICVDPMLVQRYIEADRNGRRQLPALRHDQRVGIARTQEVRLAIRDRGAFLDPRSRKDWWRGF